MTGDSCPHCKHFAPTYFELAAYYKERGDIYVGALSCMDHVKCRRVGIKGFPTLMTLNFDKKNPATENKRIVGTHTFREVQDYVQGLFDEAAFNETGTWPPGHKGDDKKDAAAVATTAPTEDKAEEEAKPGEQKRAKFWEESTLPMNQTTRIQDAASAFVFGLKQGVFMGGDVMDDEEFDALKGWLEMVSKTFPGAINRKLITKLYLKTRSLAMLDFDTWDAMLKEWQATTEFEFLQEEAKYDFTGVTVPEWQRLSDLFIGEGATYRACALYTCGQWNMFHMLTMNPPEASARSADTMVSVVASIRRFMKHFFGCVQCKDHFLQNNGLEKVKLVADAEDKPLALRRWLWETHNGVNKRLHHPQWPKPDICPTCGTEDNWELVEIDKWMRRTYAYRDVVVPLATEAATEAPTKAVADLKAAQALRRSDDEKNSEKGGEEEEEEPLVAASGEYHPKDAEMGIENAANTKELAAAVKAKAPGDGDTLESVSAPPVSLFAWYVLPVGAVAAYLLFVRSRSKQKSYRQVPRK
jgi:thiol oxidase